MLVNCYIPDLHTEGHYEMTAGVCPSVCRMPRPNFQVSFHESHRIVRQAI